MRHLGQTTVDNDDEFVEVLSTVQDIMLKAQLPVDSWPKV